MDGSSGPAEGQDKSPDPFKNNRHTGGTKGAKPVPDYLAAMRHVSKRPKAEDDTDLKKKVRKVYEKDFDKFLDRLHKAEAEHRRGAVKTQPEPSLPGGALKDQPPVETHERTEKVLGLVEEALKNKLWEQQP